MNGQPDEIDDKQRQEQFRRSIAELFIGSRIPLRHVGKNYFRAPFQVANASLSLPCVNTLSKDIDFLYQENRLQLKESLQKISHACATADLWTSYRRSYLSMTIHWMEPETLERKNDVLSCERIMGHKSHDIIAERMKVSLDSVGARGKVSTTVVDGGGNMRKALE